MRLDIFASLIRLCCLIQSRLFLDEGQYLKLPIDTYHFGDFTHLKTSNHISLKYIGEYGEKRNFSKMF